MSLQPLFPGQRIRMKPRMGIDGVFDGTIDRVDGQDVYITMSIDGQDISGIHRYRGEFSIIKDEETDDAA